MFVACLLCVFALYSSSCKHAYLLCTRIGLLVFICSSVLHVLRCVVYSLLHFPYEHPELKFRVLSCFLSLAGEVKGRQEIAWKTRRVSYIYTCRTDVSMIDEVHLSRLVILTINGYQT